MSRYAVAALMLAAVCCGCATGPGGQLEGVGFRRYLIDRGNDFADIFEARLSGGHGLMVSVKFFYFPYTHYLPVRFAAGYVNVEKVGMSGRYVGAWRQRGAEFALPFNYAFRNYLFDPIWGNEDFNALMAKLPKIKPTEPGEDLHPTPETLFDGPSLEYDFYNIGYDPNEFGMGDFPRPYRADMEVKVHMFYAGVDVGVSVKELVDFLFGWTTLDFQKDDLKARLELKRIADQKRAEEEALAEGMDPQE